MTRATRARIDTDALTHNLTQIRRRAPEARVMACVKANGYGHGLVEAAKAFRGADAFAVACIEEALEIRSSGLGHPVVLLEGVHSAAELNRAQENNFEVVIHDPWQLSLLEESHARVPVWMKIDTGMHRLGFDPAEAAEARERLLGSGGVKGELRYMTHLASADLPGGEPDAGQQIRDFLECVKDWPGERSIANSAGVIDWPESHQQWIRPGIALYGATPFADRCGRDLGLRPGMTVSTELIAIKSIRKGGQVGYGGFWTAPEDMQLGVAAIGYGDGYPWHVATGTPVLLNGELSQVVGRVSMDMVTIDLRQHPQAAVGDQVVLWGEGLPVEEIARHVGTIPYELLCGVTRRVKFDVV
ncbi:alanine racemase [Natronospira bacteriovora]|uniref:Alanine racemase n=1 Tax=Natronospira bacteriovora TaxID=3069753 RepID=A0ABU0W498_9GAMM|nr:alanine racemase [Natronospira sp. AB-CW4]MDQ2068846.1 alanine racemase [Natronospira sp. AB-CW4]